MFVNKILRFILMKLCFVLVCNADIDYFNSASWLEKEYLDPHSFYYDKHTNRETEPPRDNNNHEIGKFKGCDASACYRQLHKCKSAQNTDIADELLSRRFINILVSRAKFMKDGLYFSGRIDLEATASQLEALKNFGLGKLTLREIDPILNKVIQTPAFDPIHESVMWIHTAARFLWNLLLQHKEIVIGAFAILYLYYMLRGTRFNFWIILTLGMQLILIGSFFITWWKLIQEARIKHAAAQMKHMELPIQCQPHKMGWMDKIRSWFYTDDCEKYFEAVMREPMFQVTPAQAISHMLANIVYEPVALSAQPIATFLKHVTEHMPWWLSWIFQLVFCLGFFPTLIILIILLFGGTLNLGFGPFSILSLRGPRTSALRQSESLESKKERQPIEVILNVTANMRLSSNDTDSPARSSNMAVTASPECSEKDKLIETSPQEAVTHDAKASGDSESTKRPELSKEPVDAEVEAGVQKLKVAELGSGDHTFILNKRIDLYNSI